MGWAARSLRCNHSQDSGISWPFPLSLAKYAISHFRRSRTRLIKGRATRTARRLCKEASRTLSIYHWAAYPNASGTAQGKE